MSLVKSEPPGEAARDRLLRLLKTDGPATAAALGRALGTTGEAARQLLLRLAADGLVAFEERRAGVGRPSRLWALTAVGDARFGDTHADLAVQLLNAAQSAFGPGGLDQLIAAREAANLRLYTAALEGAADLGERVRRLAAIRAREGYMAEAREVADGFVLIENHCPICAAATACQGFCRSELSLFRRVLGPGAVVDRTDHILAGARRCAYRIIPA